MTNIAIGASWTNPGESRPSALDRLRHRLRALARLQRIATGRRRMLRAAGADIADPHMLADIGIAAPRNRGYDCIGRLAGVFAGRL